MLLVRLEETVNIGKQDHLQLCRNAVVLHYCVLRSRLKRIFLSPYVLGEVNDSSWLLRSECVANREMWANQEPFASSSSFSSSSSSPSRGPSANDPGWLNHTQLTFATHLSQLVFSSSFSELPSCLSLPLVPYFGGPILLYDVPLCAMPLLPLKRHPIQFRKPKRQLRARLRERHKVCRGLHLQQGRVSAELRKE